MSSLWFERYSRSHRGCSSTFIKTLQQLVTSQFNFKRPGGGRRHGSILVVVVDTHTATRSGTSIFLSRSGCCVRASTAQSRGARRSSWSTSSGLSPPATTVAPKRRSILSNLPACHLFGVRTLLQTVQTGRLRRAGGEGGWGVHFAGLPADQWT